MSFVLTKYDIKLSINYGINLKILVLADVHNNDFDLICEFINNISFDIMLIPGDLCSCHIANCLHNDIGKRKYSVSKDALKFLEYCVKKAKVYYSLGNHEWMYDDSDKLAVKQTGCNLLDDEFAYISNNVIIGGLSSPLKYEKNGIFPEYYKPKTNWLDKFEQCEGYKILLCHHPEYYDKYLKNRNIDLIVSGHAHGGQIRIGNQGLFAPGQGIFPKYTSGFIDNKLIISRGIANTAKIIPRINNNPEIIVLNMING